MSNRRTKAPPIVRTEAPDAFAHEMEELGRGEARYVASVRGPVVVGRGFHELERADVARAYHAGLLADPIALVDRPLWRKEIPT